MGILGERGEMGPGGGGQKEEREAETNHSATISSLRMTYSI